MGPRLHVAALVDGTVVAGLDVAESGRDVAADGAVDVTVLASVQAGADVEVVVGVVSVVEGEAGYLLAELASA